MNNINLDINTYSIKELEKLFKLSNDYSNLDIISKKNKLQENIVNSNINNIQKEELFIFLDNIRNRLENNLIDKNTNKNNKDINDLEKYDGNHFIINNLNNKYTSLLENNKNVNKSIIKKTYTIDSLFRQNYENADNESHNYLIQLPETITKAITMSVSSIEIPLTYHNISTNLNNNIFKIEKIDISSNAIVFSANIILTPGIYEVRYAAAESQVNIGNQATFSTGIIASNIVTEINQKIKNVSDSDISTNLSFNVNVKSGYSFFKYTNSKHSNFKIKIDFDVDNPNINRIKNCSNTQINQRLGSQLGFRLKELILDNSNYNIVDNDLPDAIVLSSTICYINYPRYLYIAIDDFQASSRNYFSVAADSIVAPNIVGRINILSLLEKKTAFKSGSAPGDFLYTQKHIREYFGPTDINKLRIQLLDEYGRNFSLNNMDWSFILSFECFYN